MKVFRRMENMVSFYLVIIVGITGIACYFSYQQQKSEIVADMDLTLLQAANEYQNIVENYWDIYLPLYESGQVGILADYFIEERELAPLERMELKESMMRMAQRNDRITWVAAVNPNRTVNYLFYPQNNQLQIIPQEFPYYEEALHKEKPLEIYGERENTDMKGMSEVIVLAGGTPVGSRKGTIMAGYSSSELRRIAKQGRILPSLQFGIVRQDQEIFSSGEGGTLCLQKELEREKNSILIKDGILYYTAVAELTPQNSQIFYTVKFWELFWAANRYTPMILLAIAGLLGISLTMHRMVMKRIDREVGYLQDGLLELGQNHLEYRIQNEFSQADFRQIAEDINAMAQSLKENIDRVYAFQLRQRDSEMQELQAKFNPHFLYNSLEMFRARCYENGDDETADLIAQTASIFRGFINSRTFIPMAEELAFSRRYLSLFQARYGDSVQILYDIDPEVMEYGIVRNVFQPVIENYFVHGIDPKREDNMLRFRGYLLDETHIRISVEDNGLGMEDEALERLNARLKEPIATEKESYGLKNLNQRLQLFYGEGHGLTIRKSSTGGIVFEMDIARWTCRDVEQMEAVW